MPDTRCPRCGGPLGERPARSRLTADRDVLICTTCGTDEAVRDAQQQPPVPFGEWPLT
ncbi:hypothetical protein ACIRD3_37845 [Kitasatospora sp. NPDC093550]|uniref:hypothetical protein n=1 Tax=Kitasatospora sp. NPDC093550 TaxID=3364089 RepID=UPI00382AC78D